MSQLAQLGKARKNGACTSLLRVMAHRECKIWFVDRYACGCCTLVGTRLNQGKCFEPLLVSPTHSCQGLKRLVDPPPLQRPMPTSSSSSRQGQPHPPFATPYSATPGASTRLRATLIRLRANLQLTTNAHWCEGTHSESHRRDQREYVNIVLVSISARNTPSRRHRSHVLGGRINLVRPRFKETLNVGAMPTDVPARGNPSRIPDSRIDIPPRRAVSRTQHWLERRARRTLI